MVFRSELQLTLFSGFELVFECCRASGELPGQFVMYLSIGIDAQDSNKCLAFSLFEELV